MSYSIVFRDAGDDVYLDIVGNLCLKKEGSEEETVVISSDNLDAFISFLSDERARLASREASTRLAAREVSK